MRRLGILLLFVVTWIGVAWPATALELAFSPTSATVYDVGPAQTVEFRLDDGTSIVLAASVGPLSPRGRFTGTATIAIGDETFAAGCSVRGRVWGRDLHTRLRLRVRCADGGPNRAVITVQAGRADAGIATVRLRQGNHRQSERDIVVTSRPLLEPTEQLLQLDVDPSEPGGYVGEMFGVGFHGRERGGRMTLRSDPPGSWIRMGASEPWGERNGSHVECVEVSWRLFGQRGSGSLRILTTSEGIFPVVPVDTSLRPAIQLICGAVGGTEFTSCRIERAVSWYATEAIELDPAGGGGSLFLNLAMIATLLPTTASTLLDGGTAVLPNGAAVAVPTDTIAQLLATVRGTRRDAYFDACVRAFGETLLSLDPIEPISASLPSVPLETSCRVQGNLYSWAPSPSNGDGRPPVFSVPVRSLLNGKNKTCGH